MEYLLKGLIGAVIFLSVLVLIVIPIETIITEFGWLIGIVALIIIDGLSVLIFFWWMNYEKRKLFRDLGMDVNG